MPRIRILRDIRVFGQERICCFSGYSTPMVRWFQRGESFDVAAVSREGPYVPSHMVRLCVSDGTLHMPYVDVPYDALLVDGRVMQVVRRSCLYTDHEMSPFFDLASVYVPADRAAFNNPVQRDGCNMQPDTEE